MVSVIFTLSIDEGKKLFKKNKAAEVGKGKPNEVARSLALKRKRGENAGGLDSNDDLERLQVKRRHQKNALDVMSLVTLPIFWQKSLKSSCGCWPSPLSMVA